MVVNMTFNSGNTERTNSMVERKEDAVKSRLNVEDMVAKVGFKNSQVQYVNLGGSQ